MHHKLFDHRTEPQSISPTTILTLQTTGFGSYGGIATYNRLVCRVLNSLNSGVENRVLISMEDRQAVEDRASLYPNLEMSAFGGNRLAFVKAALSVATRKRLSLVLACHVNYAPFCIMIKLLQPGTRFGVVVYGWEVWERMPWLRRWAVQQADFLISISEYTKQQAIKTNSIREGRIFLLPNAIESSQVEAPSTPPQRSGITLLSVGRLDSREQRKGFDTVIESLPTVVQRVPDVQYIIVGDGSDLDRHKQLASTVGVADRVHFAGFVNEEVLQAYYKSCDVFVMPSAQEGFGFVYLEAMQYGKSIVAANSCGAPEVVKDDVTGRLVAYGNKDDLAQTLVELCLDRDLRERLGTTGQQQLQDKYMYPDFKRKLTAILTQEMMLDIQPDESASRA